jgi:hypothetical protein
MAFSTFLMLLAGKVFIPKLRTLQKLDPLESFLPDYAIPPIGQGLVDLENEKAWFREKADASERHYLNDNPESGHSRKIIYKIWLRELAARRAVWCWNGDISESMGLWNLYGSKGVAVISRIDRIKQCLKTFAYDASFGAVAYVDRETPDPRLFDPELLKRPYFFKTRPYKFENEIRFVYPVERTRTENEPGVLVDVDSSELIEEAIFSPYLPTSEIRYVQDFLKQGIPPQPHIKTHASSRELGFNVADDLFVISDAALVNLVLSVFCLKPHATPLRLIERLSGLPAFP